MEQHHYEALRADIIEIKSAIMDLEYQKKIDDIHNALVGNHMTQDGVLIKRVINIEDKQ